MRAVIACRHMAAENVCPASCSTASGEACMAACAMPTCSLVLGRGVPKTGNFLKSVSLCRATRVGHSPLLSRFMKNVSGWLVCRACLIWHWATAFAWDQACLLVLRLDRVHAHPSMRRVTRRKSVLLRKSYRKSKPEVGHAVTLRPRKRDAT